MQEMDRRLGLLRLMLADITDREKQAQAGLATLRAQLKRVVDFTVQFNGGVGNALAGMAEVEERIVRQEAELRHLEMLRQRAEGEIHALLVTRGIADARTRLAELEARRVTLRENPSPDATELSDVEAEIAALQAEIHSASQEAARSLTGGTAHARPEPPRRG
jgi:chromosome segregation ATPase